MLQLGFVGEVLPFAAATYPEMRAKCLDALRGCLHQIFNAAFPESALFLLHKNIDHVAGHRPFHKEHQAIGRAADAFAAIGNAVNWNSRRNKRS